jgi:hypothetical protein
MATAFEKVGNYTIATEYASTAYERSGDVDDLTRLVDDSILAHKDNYIIKYGEKLINNDKFDEVCEQKDAKISGMDYKQFIGGKVAVAYYDDGNFAKALQVASNVNGTTSFKSGNALIALAERLIDKGDSKNKQTLIDGLGQIEPQAEDEITLKNIVIQNLNQI